VPDTRKLIVYNRLKEVIRKDAERHYAVMPSRFNNVLLPKRFTNVGRMMNTGKTVAILHKMALEGTRAGFLAHRRVQEAPEIGRPADELAFQCADRAASGPDSGRDEDSGRGFFVDDEPSGPDVLALQFPWMTRAATEATKTCPSVFPAPCGTLTAPSAKPRTRTPTLICCVTCLTKCGGTEGAHCYPSSESSLATVYLPFRISRCPVQKMFFPDHKVFILLDMFPSRAQVSPSTLVGRRSVRGVETVQGAETALPLRTLCACPLSLLSCCVRATGAVHKNNNLSHI